jgi:hypothetical protein
MPAAMPEPASQPVRAVGRIEHYARTVWDGGAARLPVEFGAQSPRPVPARSTPRARSSRPRRRSPSRAGPDDDPGEPEPAGRRALVGGGP